MNSSLLFKSLVFSTVLLGLAPNVLAQANKSEPSERPVIYQVFPRLFGNQNTTNKPWGTIEENGVGKFADFTPTALNGIKELGTTHVWFTGVPRHALMTDYSAFGVPSSDADVVKGLAGSPYAVMDYYDVNPDLATDPANRIPEFEALIARVHAAGMKVVIDIVPNHVARTYKSVAAPDDIPDFGADDDTSKAYLPTNDFYYIPGSPFQVPDKPKAATTPGGDGVFAENPAKWTGNGSRLAKPKHDDWYETVKINYGIAPDGSHDFPPAPNTENWKEAAANWQGKQVPPSWVKFRDIALYWLDKGVDGFRYDMAEMVPVAFWSYMNSAIKAENPDAYLIAEIYNPAAYSAYHKQGLMDALYDKVGLYDTLKAVIQNRAPASDILKHTPMTVGAEMLHFMENHDEQRIASPDFAGDAFKGFPGMVVSATIGKGATLLYFGQTVGEDGSEKPGFGGPTRTSIFDYMGVPALQRWMNGGAFDGGKLTAAEKSLRARYIALMQASKHPAFQGDFINLESGDDRVFAFMRKSKDYTAIVVSNFSGEKKAISLKISEHSKQQFSDALSDNQQAFEMHNGTLKVSLDPHGSVILIRN